MVELRSGRGYHGTLDGYDVPHMNLVLKNADEMLFFLFKHFFSIFTYLV